CEGLYPCSELHRWVWVRLSYPRFGCPTPVSTPTIQGGHMLTAKCVERTKKPGRYRDSGDGGVKGLLLQISDSGAKSWVLRYERHGRERMMGLGSAKTFNLKEARQRARAARQLLADDIDPLANKHATKQAAKLAEQRKLTFREAAQKYFDQNESK